MDLLTKAKSVAERVEAEATKADVPVAVCIIDVHGNLVLQHRMNGAPLFALEISERKAYTSALVRLRTADILPLVQPGQSLYALPTVGGGRFCPMGGGIPLVDEDGKVYAGVGVSGGTAEEDVAIAEAAVG
ncbi:heme-binding protein [Mesorhizobium sp. B283B1A]|uniref:GlcG/HbpS family heme-binding protein n=1 Tax=Mesorhizobium TaxID=68287 RepID=UPI001CD0612D|nr:MULTISPECIES: heme-binding protein [Mesorhizobium]MCA0046310.1 heme-binding protein [Mesorhizobium sp. B283B1A]UQS62774.1 heme-binding protein [Mesorhizobium opportunistum]